MDDFVLFHDRAAALEDARPAIAEWLRENRCLELNPKHQQARSNDGAGTFLGYRVSRAGITPGRKLRRRMRQKLRRAASGEHEILVRSLMSYRGLLLF